MPSLGVGFVDLLQVLRAGFGPEQTVALTPSLTTAKPPLSLEQRLDLT
jgi:hypothetical protein